MKLGKINAAIYALLILAVSASCTDRNAPTPQIITGVWANADCELLRTNGFTLIFERCDGTLGAYLYKMDGRDTVLLGKTLFDKDSVRIQQVWKPGDVQSPADLGTLQSDGRLRVAVGNHEQLLEKVEQIDITTPYEMLKASPLETGDCIQQWCLGAKFGQGDGWVAFEAGTNRHSYTFNIQPGFVYCRAARLRFNDHGGLFAQNIRMMSNPREHSSFMAEDNLSESSAPLIINNSKFSPDQCVFDQDGIYWSFIRFDADTAVLNGCGEIYRFARPQPGDPALSEWFAFDKYEQETN